jgi:hypothetical protein
MAMPSLRAAPFRYRRLAADAIAGIDMRDETGLIRRGIQARGCAGQWQRCAVAVARPSVSTPAVVILANRVTVSSFVIVVRPTGPKTDLDGAAQ